MVLSSSLLVCQTNERQAAAPAVVFVCEHGAAKSIIAAAEFNRLAEQKGMPQRAIARGTNPDAQFAPTVAAGLSKDGLSVPAGKPELLSATDVEKADRVITLDCKLPEPLDASAKAENWSGISSPSQSFEAARKEIASHVRQLIKDMARDPVKK